MTADGSQRIRVLVVDDQPLVRSGLRMILSAHDDVEVVGESEDGRAAVDAAVATSPHVVLMDIRMPGKDGIEATAEILSLRPDIRVIILTTFDPDEYVYRALRAGASGFVLKDIPPDDLVHAVRVVAAGEALLSPSVTRRLIEDFAHGGTPEQDDRLDDLSEREVEILRCLGRGMTNAEIADSLFISQATVKTHVSSVLTKLGLRDRTQAVVFAYENGVIRPGSS